MRCSLHHRVSEIAASVRFFSPSFSPLCFVLFNFLSSVDLFREGRFGGRELMSLIICFLIAVKGLRVGLLLSCDVTVGLTYTAGTGALQSLIDRGPVLLPLYLEPCENKNGRDTVQTFFLAFLKGDPISQGVGHMAAWIEVPVAFCDPMQLAEMHVWGHRQCH